MCDPVSIGLTTAAVSAGSAIVGFIGESQQAKAARRADRINYAGDYNALADKGVQTSAAASEDRFQSYIESLKAQGRVSASAGSLGIGAQTAQQLTRAETGDITREAAISDLNYKNAQQQNQTENVSAYRAEQSRLAAHKGPTPGELVIGLAKSGLKGVSAYSGAGGKF